MAAPADANRIVVRGKITLGRSLQLLPGQQLAGSAPDAVLVFAGDVDGVRLSRDNDVEGLRIQVDPDRRAIYNDSSVDELGTIRLAAVTATGQVQVLARGRVRGGHVVVDGLNILAADVRDRAERPALLGVGALQGAFTLWNQQPDGAVVVTAELRGLSAGRTGTRQRSLRGRCDAGRQRWPAERRRAGDRAGLHRRGYRRRLTRPDQRRCLRHLWRPRA